MAMVQHVANPRIKEREAVGPHLIKQELDGFNGKIAVLITNGVGTMWCAYVFAALAFVSLPAAVRSGDPVVLVSWISQTFLQLVLLSVIMVGQNVLAAAADKRSEATYNDADAVLHEAVKIQEHLAAQDKVLEAVVDRMQMERH